ncbi:GAF domain-containing protein [Pseudomonas sp. CFBP 13711]|jgi:signal transduction histidine kinase|uniref:ATP-binding protein n=1 Tax=unclassified Pseudomonas TaxID=196821 RepID=UPI00178220F7|nr:MULTISPECIES: ATP-binding protein [unclassified Pseudomonas]MBD8708820.1 GAF domain-containing protein [Pseudomonas sp. CFBP 13711]MBD8713682.1 GAF domain-containing protein [Pseudomonas sp. CFBP 13715]
MAHHPAPFPFNEEERVLSLEHLDVLDSANEKAFDDIVLLATTLCDAPIALVSLVDRERQWFKACVGLGVQETHRDLAFCGHAILDPVQVLVVEDAALDPRFASSPLVLGPPFIRFYAGAPIVTDSGVALGTVCVIDTRARQLSERQSLALQALARQAAALLEARLLSKQRERQLAQFQDQFQQAEQNPSEVTPLLQNSGCISSLGMLTASIAHDFNNLLQSVSAAFQLTRLRSRRPVDVERFAETGLQAVEQGRQLISYLMSSVRGDGPELICIDVTARLHAAQPLMRHSMSEGIDLDFDLAEWGWGVLCVEAQLHAVVMNLLSNARDALKGSGQIRVSTRWVHVEDDLSLQQGDYLVVSVSDNGPGMPAEVARQVFEPFFTTKATGEGTGLGLAQVKDFAIKSGGDARIETAPGAGTTVSLYLRILGCIATSEAG